MYSFVCRIREYISEYPTMYFDFEENSGGFLTKIGYKEQKIFDEAKNDTENIRLSKIISLISKNNKITTSKIAEILKVSRSSIAGDIKMLKEKNKLLRIGGDRGGYWQIIK